MWFTGFFLNISTPLPIIAFKESYKVSYARQGHFFHSCSSIFLFQMNQLHLIFYWSSLCCFPFKKFNTNSTVKLLSAVHVIKDSEDQARAEHYFQRTFGRCEKQPKIHHCKFPFEWRLFPEGFLIKSFSCISFQFNFSGDKC